VAIIVSHDRKGYKHLQVATRGRISEQNLNEVLKDKITPDSVLCSETHYSYIAFANSNKLEQKTVKAGAKEFVKEGKYHIQQVNQTSAELKKWLDGFNGVSTKYLQNYLNWFSVLKRIEKANIPIKEKALILMCFL
jgi:transposase-like protein